ncbi:MAG: DUF3450 domain-containing protein [Gammaproteobacteria bacterium]|nr:DUF3450 domain-containing protein [Gammaproteobacteria bacterium]
MKKSYKNSVFSMTLATCALCIACPGGAAADALDSGRKLIADTNNSLKNTQEKINALNDETKSMLDKYKSVIRESETYTTYNRQLSEIIQSQNDELASLNQQIDEIDVTSREVMPLMERMIDALDAFVEQDLPFLPQERQQRIAGLKRNLIKADLTVAEKYRKILEAYQIEIEYGRTLEAYAGELDGKQLEFVRLGRTALFYQSLDKTQVGVWNKHQRTWQTVEDSEVQQSVSNAIKIARKQRSPELLTVLASKIEE